MTNQESADVNQALGDKELKNSIREKVAEQLDRIINLAEYISGKDPWVENVFTSPPEVRADAPEPTWSDDQIAKAREVAHSFGYGAEANVASGLNGGVRIVEGGLAWKIAAEAVAAEEDGDPSRIIFAGSPYRILREDEIAFIQKRYEVSLASTATEYDSARLAAKSQASTLYDEETALPFGYEIAASNPTTQVTTGQLSGIGTTEKGQEVQLLRVDREVYEEDDIPKYRHQPASEALMRFVADVLAAEGKHDDPVGLITSSTYASRLPNAIRVGLNNGRQFGVAMYGRATLAEVKDESIAPDSPLNQLPGDLRVMYDNLRKLEAEIAQP